MPANCELSVHRANATTSLHAHSCKHNKARECWCAACPKCQNYFSTIKGMDCGSTESWSTLGDGTPNPWHPKRSHGNNTANICKVKCASSPSCVAFVVWRGTGQCRFQKVVNTFRVDAAASCYFRVQQSCRDPQWLKQEIGLHLRAIREKGTQRCVYVCAAHVFTCLTVMPQ